MDDPFDLKRFVDAQKPVYDEVLGELRRGSKETHWIWFVFPQHKDLGRSRTARTYGITSRAEAAAYLAHPILGTRLTECTRLVNLVEGRSAVEILGGIDAVKFRSSMTLFAEVAADTTVFADALRKYFAGRPDQLTLDRL